MEEINSFIRREEKPFNKKMKKADLEKEEKDILNEEFMAKKKALIEKLEFIDNQSK